MKKILIAALIALATASVLAIQVQRLSDLQQSTASLEGRATQARAQVQELNLTIEATHKQMREFDAHSRSLTAAAASPSMIRTEPPTDPAPEELVWNNGHDYLWIEKNALTPLGISPLKSTAGGREAKHFLDSPRFVAVFKEFEEHLASLSPGDAQKDKDDPTGAFRRFAADRLPQETIDQIVNALDEFMNPDQKVPAYSLNPIASLALGLEPQQASATMVAFNDFVSRVRKLERDNLEVLPPDPGSIDASLTNTIALRMRPFAEQGEMLKNELKSNLQSIIRAERTELWMRMAAPQLEGDLGDLGKEARKLILSFAGDRYSTRNEIGGNSMMSGGKGTAPLDASWRAFIRKTTSGYEVVK